MTDKLVRDRIPDVIRRNGEPCVLDTHYRKADPEEMRELLVDKLYEEADEYSGASDGKYSGACDPEELVDILEVVLHLAALDGIDARELERRRRAKCDLVGGFWDRWVLFRKTGP